MTKTDCNNQNKGFMSTAGRVDNAVFTDIKDGHATVGFYDPKDVPAVNIFAG